MVFLVPPGLQDERTPVLRVKPNWISDARVRLLVPRVSKRNILRESSVTVDRRTLVLCEALFETIHAKLRGGPRSGSRRDFKRLMPQVTVEAPKRPVHSTENLF